MSIPFALSIGGASPRLVRLAQTRAKAIDLAGDHASSADARIRADASVVLDRDALLRAVANAVAARRAFAVSAREIDGTIRGGAATIVPAGADDADPLRTDDVVGTWLPGADDRLPSPSGAAVNLFSHIFGATGYAAVGRGLALGLRRAGIDARIASEWGEMGNPGLRERERAELRALVGAFDANAASVLIRPPVAPNGQTFLSDYRAVRTRGPAVAYTMFECDGIPQRWVGALEEFERLWVPSRFNLRSYIDAGVPAERLDLVPIGIDAPRYAEGESDFPLPNRRGFAFLSVFDWNERKGPDVLLRAWAAAFGPADDVVLYLRTGGSTVGAQGSPLDLARRLGLDPARMAPIEVLHEDLPAARYEALFRTADAFVLTSRGEAFGIPLLEAMAAGIPAIGTGYGGSTDFLDETSGYPIPARIVPVAPALAARISFYADQRWADPSVEATAAAMRRVVDDPADTQRRAAAGFVRAQLRFDRRATALIARDALAALPRRRRGVHGTNAVVLAAPFRSTGAAGAAGRSLAAALAREGTIVRTEDTAAREIPDDADSVRRRRETAHVLAEPGDVRIAVDTFAPDARVVLLTADPPTGELRPGVELWTPDPVLRERLIERGVPRERCKLVPLPLEVDRWTPDVRGGDVDSVPLVVVGGEPRWDDAVAVIARLFDADRPVRVLVRAGEGTPGDPAAVSAGFERALRSAGTGWVPGVVLLSEAATTTNRAAALGAAALAVAADPGASAHDAVRACGVPVIDLGDETAIRAVLADPAERWRRARADRLAALARAATARRTVREALDALALRSEPVERTIAPTRIAIHLDAALADATATRSSLREGAVHTLIDDERHAHYVVEVDGALRVPFGWDETLINALESGTAPIVRAQRYDELIAPAGQAVPPFDALAQGGFLLSREGGHVEPSAGAGLRLRRAGTREGTSAWVVYACLVETTTPLVAVR